MALESATHHAVSLAKWECYCHTCAQPTYWIFGRIESPNVETKTKCDAIENAMLLRIRCQRIKGAHCFHGMLTASIIISLNARILHVTCFVFIVNWPWTLWAITSKSYCAYSLHCHSVPIAVYAGTGAIHLIRPSTKCGYHFIWLVLLLFCYASVVFECVHLFVCWIALLVYTFANGCWHLSLSQSTTTLFQRRECFFFSYKFTLYRSVSMIRFGLLWNE